MYYDGGDGDSDGGVLWWGRDLMGRKSLMVVGEEEEEEEEGRSVEESSRRSAPSFVLASVADGKGCTEVVPGLYRVCLAELVRDGLDAVARQSLLSILIQILAEGCSPTMLIATHDTELVERMSDRILVMQKGRLINQTSLEQLQLDARGALQHELMVLLDSQADDLTKTGTDS